MQMVGPWGRYLPQWLRVPCKGSGPARSTQYADGRTLGRYLPQWLRAPYKGSGPARSTQNADGRTLGWISTPVVKGARQREWPRHLSTHTHTHWTLPTTMSVLETPFDIHVSSVYQTHTCMQAPIPTLCISAKKTHNKGSRTRPIMSTLMPRSGIPVICSELRCHATALIILAGNEDNHKSLDKFEFRQNSTTDFEVSCP